MKNIYVNLVWKSENISQRTYLLMQIIKILDFDIGISLKSCFTFAFELGLVGYKFDFIVQPCKMNLDTLLLKTKAAMT